MLAIDNPATWNILLVDDNEGNRTTLALVLDFFDAHVNEAASGQEALDLLRSTPKFNLCLLDILMSGISGWDVFNAIRLHPLEAIRDMPVIAVTALTMPNERKDILDAGFTGYLAKPVDPRTLTNAISEILAAPKDSRTT